MRCLALGVAVLVGCNPNLSLDPTTEVACGSNGECPSGLTCVNGLRCVAEAAIDATGAASPITPADGELRVGGADTPFAWSPVGSAIAYTITIGTSPDLLTPLMEESVRATSFKAALPEGTY